MEDVVVLQASDGPRLNVEREVLSSASEVLASLIEESDTLNAISLPERADHLRFMLDLLVNPPPSPPTPATLWRIATVLPILQKYELDQLVLSLKSTLRKAAGDTTSPKIFVFLAAARLSSIDICATCIRNGGAQTWREVLQGLDDEVEEEIGIERDMRELSSFDVKGWSESVSVKVPADVMSRLWTAQMGLDLDGDGPELTKEVWVEVARRFKGA